MKFSKMSSAAVLVLEVFSANLTVDRDLVSMHCHIMSVAVAAGVECAAANITWENRAYRTINIQSCNRHLIRQVMGNNITNNI